MAENKVNITIAATDLTGPAMASAARGVKDLSEKASATGSAFSAMGSMAIASMAGFSATAMISQLLEAGKAAERLKNSFAAAAGSISGGVAAMSFVRAESQRLGLDLTSAADGYMKISAASKGTQLEGAGTQAIFRSVAGASTALGLSAEQTNGALLAISQMMSKGTVSAEELRGQLGERLPGAFQIAARSMGVSTAELGKMVEQGKVVSEDFLPKFAAELEKTFPPAETAMKGLTAETNRLKTAWFELNAQVMESGGASFGSAVVRQFSAATTAATEYLRTLDKIGAKLPAGLIIGGATALGAISPIPGGAAIGAGLATAGIMATANATGARNDYGKILPPLSRTDKNLLGSLGDGLTGVGPGGGAGYLLGDSANIFSQQSTILPNVSKEVEAAYDKQMKSLEKLKDHRKGKDLLLEQILSYESDIAKIIKAEEKANLEKSENLSLAFDGMKSQFAISTMQTGDLSTGDRYQPKKLSLLNPQPSRTMVRDPDQLASQNIQYSAIMAGGDPLKEMNNRRQAQIESIQKWDETELGMAEKKASALTKIDQDYYAAKEELEKRKTEGLQNSLESSLGQMSNMLMQGSKKQFEAGKELGKMMIAIDTARAASSAFAGAAAAGGPWGVAMGVAAGIAAIAVGTMNMARLDSVQYTGARALGGPVTGGASYLVGERGPEIFTPGASGQITSNDKLQGLGGTVVNNTQVFQVSTGVADTVRAEMARMLPMFSAHAVSSVKSAMMNGQFQGVPA